MAFLYVSFEPRLILPYDCMKTEAADHVAKRLIRLPRWTTYFITVFIVNIFKPILCLMLVCC